MHYTTEWASVLCCHQEDTATQTGVSVTVAMIFSSLTVSSVWLQHPVKLHLSLWSLFFAFRWGRKGGRIVFKRKRNPKGSANIKEAVRCAVSMGQKSIGVWGALGGTSRLGRGDHFLVELLSAWHITGWVTCGERDDSSQQLETEKY